MQDHLVLCSFEAPRFGVSARLYPLNPTLISNQSTSTAQAIAARAAILAN